MYTYRELHSVKRFCNFGSGNTEIDVSHLILLLFSYRILNSVKFILFRSFPKYRLYRNYYYLNRDANAQEIVTNMIT